MTLPPDRSPVPEGPPVRSSEGAVESGRAVILLLAIAPLVYWAALQGIVDTAERSLLAAGCIATCLVHAAVFAWSRRHPVPAFGAALVLSAASSFLVSWMVWPAADRGTLTWRIAMMASVSKGLLIFGGFMLIRGIVSGLRPSAGAAAGRRVKWGLVLFLAVLWVASLVVEGRGSARRARYELAPLEAGLLIINSLREDDRERRLALLDRAIDVDPQNPEGYYRRARERAERNDLHGALADLDRALENSSRDVRIRATSLLLRGDLREQSGDREGAIGDYEGLLSCPASDVSEHKLAEAGLKRLRD